MQTKYILLVGLVLLVGVGIGAYVLTNNTPTQQEGEQENAQENEQTQEQEAEIKTQGNLSVEEYAQWCGDATQRLAVEVGEVYQGYKLRVKELVREVNNINPPAELEELYGFQKQEIEKEHERIKDKPDNEEFDPFELARDEELLNWAIEFSANKQQAISALSQATQNALLESRCIDQNDLQTE